MLTRCAKRCAVGFVVGVIGVATYPSDASAHFVLNAPPSWMSQDTYGLPEKLGPCGDEDDGTDAATPTGIVTAYQEGDSVTVTVNEVIFHPGHYRIALAVKDRSELPPEPVVTVGSTPCGSAAIQSPPVFPVLADDVFDHTAPFSGPQSITVKLPPGTTCDKCTLQVIEFMAEHGLNVPGGCFYHHCADISIKAKSGGGGDGGNPPPGDAGAGGSGGHGAGGSGGGGGSSPDAGGPGVNPGSSSSGGCSCQLGGGGMASGAAASFVLMGLAAWRRKKSQRRRTLPPAA